VIFTDPLRSRPQGIFLENYEAPLADYLGTTASEAFTRNPLPSVGRAGEQARERGEIGEGFFEGQFPDPTREPSRKLHPEEANKRFGHLGLTFNEPVFEGEAGLLARRKELEVARQSVFQRAPSGFGPGAASIGIELLVTATDPLNVASAFIPVVREARFARLTERFGRTTARVIRGGAEGAVGAVAVEPFVLGQARREQADYDLTHSLLNIAFGTALGGGLHAVAGKIGDRLRASSQRAREASLRSAIAEVVEGRKVATPERVLLLDDSVRGDLFGSTAVSRGGFAERFAPQDTPLRLPGQEEIVPAAAGAAPASSRAALGRKDEPLVFTDRKKAEKFVQKEKRKKDGRKLQLEEAGDEIILRERTEAQPLRQPDGSVLTFKTERSAKKHIERVRPGQAADLDVVPVGKAGEREFAIVSDATKADLASFRAAPESVRFAAPPPKVEAVPNARQLIEQAVKEAADPRSLTLPDFRGADLAEERLAEVTPAAKPEDAQAMLDEEMEQISELQRQLELSDDEVISLFNEADEGIRNAEDLGKAARAAAICELRTA